MESTQPIRVQSVSYHQLIGGTLKTTSGIDIKIYGHIQSLFARCFGWGETVKVHTAEDKDITVVIPKGSALKSFFEAVSKTTSVVPQVTINKDFTIVSRACQRDKSQIPTVRETERVFADAGGVVFRASALAEIVDFKSDTGIHSSKKPLRGTDPDGSKTCLCLMAWDAQAIQDRTLNQKEKNQAYTRGLTHLLSNSSFQGTEAALGLQPEEGTSCSNPVLVKNLIEGYVKKGLYCLVQIAGSHHLKLARSE